MAVPLLATEQLSFIPTGFLLCHDRVKQKDLPSLKDCPFLRGNLWIALHMIAIFKGLKAFQSVYQQGCNANLPLAMKMTDWFKGDLGGQPTLMGELQTLVRAHFAELLRR